MSNEKTRSNNVGPVAILIKIGTKLLSVSGKILGFLTKGKIGVATSTAAYGFLTTWQFAFMLMFGLVIHELGHVWAMKKVGMKIQTLNFVPFLGAMIVPEEAFRSRKEEAFIAIMGPVFGLAASVVLGTAYFVTGSVTLAAGAAFTALLNLFNLIPVNPLDGGRILKSIAFSIHSKMGFVTIGLGLAITITLVIIGLSWFIAFLFLLGVSETIFELRHRRFIPAMNRRQIGISSLAYVAVAVVGLTIMEYMEHVPGAHLAMKTLTS